MDLLLIGGIIYGVILIMVMFVKTKFTEPFRIDALIIPGFSEKTRPINLVAGICFAGYSIYSLLNG
ncbi:MAG: hypothetical protein EPN85_09130 [Bacteroidetes bacterium]|nr:MAG: hypothetical protein EPN85_09130 [Bacteroidota bacterium]